MPFDECLQVGLSLTSALEHLHRHGLVHRDVKPSNIIFVEGQPKLADIGLVAGVEEAQSFVGTEGYIPPEGPGKPQADLYSLGIVLYVMSTGKRHDAFPEPVGDPASDPDHPRWLELNAIIHKACHGDPRERYVTAEEMRADLVRLEAGKSVRRRQTWRRMAGRTKRVWPVTGSCGVAPAGGSLGPATGRIHATGCPDGKGVGIRATVPRMREPTVSPDDLRGRITDAFIDSLALIEGVRRSPRKSGWVHQDEELLRRSLAETNDMRHILTGRISGAADVVTLTLSLYKRGENQPVWKERFSGTTNEAVELEKHALARVAEMLGLKVTESEQHKIELLLKNNLEALKWMRRALDTYQSKAGTQAGYTEVSALTQKALDLDPNYTDAEAMMVYQLRNLSQDRPAVEIWPAVNRGMSQVLEKDDTHANALDQVSAYTLVYARDWNRLLELAARELESRSGANRSFVRAFWYRTHGWFEEARIVQAHAEEHEPTAVDVRFHMAASRWAERRYADGVQVARRTLELYPGHAEGHFWQAHCLVAQGDFAAGLQAIDMAQEAWKKQEMTALKGFAYAKMGNHAKAQEVLRELMELRRTGPYLQPYFVARIYAALGESAIALDWLEKADEDRSEYLFLPDFGGLRTDPAWDGLQNEPRYWQLCERLGLGKNQWPRPKPEPMP